MGEVLSIEEIEKRYPAHWILIRDPVKDAATGRVVGGVVHAAGADHDEVCLKGLDIPPPRYVAIRCTQKEPDDTVFVL